MACLLQRSWPGHSLRAVMMGLLWASLAVPAGAQTAPETTSADGPALPASDFARVPQAAAAPQLIGNNDIVKMAKAGLSETILLQTVQLQPGHYDTSPDAVIALNAAGVPQTVISAMQRAGTGLHSRPLTGSAALSQPATAATQAPLLINPSPIAPGIDDIGVYYQDKSGLWQPMHLERVIFKSGGTVKNVLSDGFIKRDMNGYIDQPHSPLPLKAGATILIYTPAGTEAAEYSFLQFREKPDHREFRILAGGLFHSESGTRRDEITYTPTKVGPRLYTFVVPSDIVKGEYGVLPPGAANQRGLADSGKIYTFTVPE